MRTVVTVEPAPEMPPYVELFATKTTSRQAPNQDVPEPPVPHPDTDSMPLHRLSDVPLPAPRRGRATATRTPSTASLSNSASDSDLAAAAPTRDGAERKPRRRKLADLPFDEAVDAAKNIALNSLAAMPRTRAQLEKKLTDKELPEPVIAAALDRLTDVGLIDDAAYAHTYTQSAARDRSLAAPAIRRDLHRKGIPADLIQAALDELDPTEQTDQAYRFAARRAATLPARLTHDQKLRRLAGQLARKGYPSGIAFSAARDALHNLPADDIADLDD